MMYENEERRRHSRYARKPVNSSEWVIRLVYYPQHIDQQGNLLPEAIPTQDLRDSNRGWSTFRRHLSSKSDVQFAAAHSLNRIVGREIESLRKVLVADIRNVVDEISGDRQLYVWDDARSGRERGHAIVVARQGLGHGMLKKLRKELIDLLNKIRIGRIEDEWGSATKRLVGDVMQRSSSNTFKVLVVRTRVHPRFGKKIQRSKRYLAHDPVDACREGDRVAIIEVPPFSKRKRWMVFGILEREEET
jgi:small subunit ribosomal protein S17